MKLLLSGRRNTASDHARVADKRAGAGNHLRAPEESTSEGAGVIAASGTGETELAVALAQMAAESTLHSLK